jgi:hypothetical protein
MDKLQRIAARVAGSEQDQADRDAEAEVLDAMAAGDSCVQSVYLQLKRSGLWEAQRGLPWFLAWLESRGFSLAGSEIRL